MAAIRRLPSGKWSAEVRLPNGRRTTKTDTSKTFVRKWAADLESAIRRGEWVDPATLTARPAENLTLGQWREKWIASRNREFNTAESQDLTWKLRVSYWKNHQLTQITRLEIETWSKTLADQGTGPNSHGKALGHLRQLLRAAVDHRLLDTDPSQGVKKPTRPLHVDRILTRDEWEKLDTSTGHDPMVRLMLWCGLRWGEAAGLHGTEVDLDKNRLWIIRVNLKNGKLRDYPKTKSCNRILPIPDIAASALREILHPGRLFTSPTGRGLRYSNWYKRWSPWLAAARLPLPRLTPHDLRHTYGSRLADAGMPIHDIAALMGHDETRSTERYVHSSMGRMQSALDALKIYEKGPSRNSQ